MRMFDSYFQNSNIGVTKATYFEICEQLGTEPIDSEIPVELDDFPSEVQQAFMIYFRLRDEWDGMSGSYMGKSFVGLQDVLDIYQIAKEDRQSLLDWILSIDSARSKAIDLARPKN